MSADASSDRPVEPAHHAVSIAPVKLSWAAMLARWIDFARGAVALPDDGDGGRVKQVASDIITLQAVWFALRHLDGVAPDERALGLDRARVLIDRSTRAIQRQFNDASPPPALRELIDDAREALREAQTHPPVDADPGVDGDPPRPRPARDG